MIPRWIFAPSLGGLLGLGACFTAPGAPVLFSCDPHDAPACPEGYTCRRDGCCHREDHGDGESGACRLGDRADTGTDSGTDETEPTGDGGSE